MLCAVGVVLWGTSLRRELPTCQKKRYDFFCHRRLKALWYGRETHHLNNDSCDNSSGGRLMLLINGVPASEGT